MAFLFLLNHIVHIGHIVGVDFYHKGTKDTRVVGVG